MTCEHSTHVGRPRASIDWEYVDELLEGGCSGAEIAGTMGLNPATIYERCVTDRGMPFSEYSQRKYSKGATLLRMQQYKKALGLTEAGDNTQLIWLGKTRLKQIDASSEIQPISKMIVEVKYDGLGSGLNISTPSISNSNYPRPE